MGLKKLKPTTPATRFYTVSTFEEVTRTKPEKSLIAPLKSSGGRNNQGRITSRHRGGAHKKFYRIIDFKRDKVGIDAKVATIEYDPNGMRGSRCSTMLTERNAISYLLKD